MLSASEALLLGNSVCASIHSYNVGDIYLHYSVIKAVTKIVGKADKIQGKKLASSENKF